MSEIEVPIEEVQEHIHHEAHSGPKWVGMVALCSAIIAAMAAVAALMAGHHGNEAMIDQIQASDTWAYYQAKSTKAAILNSKIGILESLGKPVNEADREKAAEYTKDQKELTETAKEKEESSRHHLHTHEALARAVTFFQVCIAIAAVSVLTRRRPYWYVSLLFAVFGIGSFVMGLLH